jgi:HAMP domain-containing protein
MKSSIPAPVAIGIVVVVIAVIGFFIWKNSAATTSDVKAVTQTVNEGKPSTEAVPADQAAGDTVLMGGKGGR